MTRLISRVTLALIGLILPLLMLELVVRILGLAPPAIPNPTIWELHSELGWWHIPNSGGTFYSSFNEFEVDVQINSLGLRDSAYVDQAYRDSAEIRDESRILILADSFGEALQVPLEDTFYKQLQEKMTENGQPTQTINSGVGSWGTDQEATYYRLEGRKFKPKLTLLFFFTRNDVVNNYGPLEIARNGGSIQKSYYQLDDQNELIYPPAFDPDRAYDQATKPPPLPPAPLMSTADWLWVYSALYRWATPYLQDIPVVVQTLGPSGILGGEGRVRATHPSIPVPFFVYQTPQAEEWVAAWHLTEAILRDLQQQVEADDGEFAVIIIPAREQVYTNEWTRTVSSSEEMTNLTWNLDLPNQQLEDILTRNQILHLDLLPIFRESALQNNTLRLYFRHDGHWTKDGHRLAADAIYRFLSELGLTESQQTKSK